MKFGKILVVEDNKPITRVLFIKLKEKGYEVQVANDGKEALEKLEADHIDLFLLDLVMPEMDVFSFIEEFNKKGIKAGIIVVSNVADEENIKKLKELGINDYLVKTDYKLEEIADKVDEYFENK